MEMGNSWRVVQTSYTPPMDLLWTPWRYRYVTTADTATRPGVPPKLNDWPGPGPNSNSDCVFCNLLASIEYAVANGWEQSAADAEGLIVHRGQHCFVCLNAFPYATGHIMVLPYTHQSSLAALPVETAHEIMDLAQRAERILTKLYHPHGINMGLNLGQAAGAGVAGHLHLHALPRWVGDTNFMTTIAETRVLPESLEITWKRMREGFMDFSL